MASNGDHGPVSEALLRYGMTVPINALTAFGFGPFARGGTERPDHRLARLQSSLEGIWSAVETIGVTARELIAVLAAAGGELSAEQFAFQTAAAPPDIISEALDRLVVAGVAQRVDGGAVAFTSTVRDVIVTTTRSIGDQGGPLSDSLAVMCRRLGLDPGTRKQDRVDAIAAAFADPARHAAIRERLSPAALTLLGRIAAESAGATVPSEVVGIESYFLRLLSPSRYAAHRRGETRAELEALDELAVHAMVGIGEYDGELWIWREAWPFVGRPFIGEWAVAPQPARLPVVHDGEPSIPAIVSTVDHVLRAWMVSPPLALKNDEPRVGKPQVRTLARELGVGEIAVDVAGRLMIGMGLVLRNVVSQSGRGRNRRVETAWMPDPNAVDVWAGLSRLHRWACLVAEWCSPRAACGQQLLANRHLLLWELAVLDEADGYDGDDAFAGWFAHRYASLGHPEAVAECIADLRELGVVSRDRLALTRLGRAVLDDPTALASAAVDESTSAFVQSDLTVIAPADLRRDLASALERIAVVESSSGAVTYRLDPVRITRAVQGDDTVESIVEMLTGLSATPLPDTVTRLVADAGRKAGSVRLISAPTVLLVSDPVDLAAACAMKALKLTRVSDTVAISDVPLAKVRAALERKGLAPHVLGGLGSSEARSSSEDAARLQRRVEDLRRIAGGRGGAIEAEAKRLEQQARLLADAAGRFAIAGPVALSPVMVRTLAGAKP